MKLKLTLKPPFILYNDDDTLCECGEHRKCVRKINASDNGRLWVENKDHFRCGKVRNKIMNYSARGCMYCEGVCNKECLPKQDIIKTEEDAKIFVEALENIPEPNDKLKKAFIDFGKQEPKKEKMYSEEEVRHITFDFYSEMSRAMKVPDYMITDSTILLERKFNQYKK